MALPTPPKFAPVGEISKLADPWEVLLSSSELSQNTKESLRPIVEALKSQQLLMARKILALEAQSQALMAQFDWTKVRP